MTSQSGCYSACDAVSADTSAVVNNRSCDLPDVAILDNYDADITVDRAQSHSRLSPMKLSEYTPTRFVVFTTPALVDIDAMDIFDDCIKGVCECVHLIDNAPCQLRPCRWADYLFGSRRPVDVSEDERLYLWRGITSGFNIVDSDCPSSYNCANYDSILEPKCFAEMSEILVTEIAEHKVVKSASTPRCVHSLGAVIKPNGKLRPITDCSRPDAVSINNFMSSTFSTFTYNSVEDVVDLLSPGDFMCVVDISSAYRSVNVSPNHVTFQGLSWDFGSGAEYLLDRRLCFGLRCAPKIVDSISNFIVSAVKRLGVQRVVNYLDDFIIVGATPECCLMDRNTLTSLLSHLGFVVAWKKVTNPSQVTTFLGITIDSVRFELSLPLEKVAKLRSAIMAILDKDRATKKDLERVGGLMSHCSYVVKGGRTFSRRVFDLVASYQRSATSIPIGSEIRCDFEWWLAFCHVFNGRACILKGLDPVPMVSDSSFLGFGAWAGPDWILGCWNDFEDLGPIPSSCIHGQLPHRVPPPTFQEPGRNINVCELWPVVAGLHRWAPLYKNCRLHVITDNMQVLAMINTGRSSNRTCMAWLREIYWICFVNNLDLFASYVKSADNVLADALSRAAAPGAATKCDELLSQFNMCCSHPICSEIPSEPTVQTTSTTGCRPSKCDQEKQAVPN